MCYFSIFFNYLPTNLHGNLQLKTFYTIKLKYKDKKLISRKIRVSEKSRNIHTVCEKVHFMKTVSDMMHTFSRFMQLQKKN